MPVLEQLNSERVGDNAMPVTASLRDVLTTLNRGVSGIVFIIDVDHRLLGIFTDGDARRAMLAGARIDDPAVCYMNAEFVAGDVNAEREDNVRLLSEQVRHLPLLDTDGRLCDFLSWAEMWKVPAMMPSLGGSELKYVTDCITSGWISSQGAYVRRFEAEFAAHHGALNALTTSNGTAALHLAMTALGIGSGDEVLIPDFTFAACANAVIHTGATPVFVDVDADTWTLDPSLIEAALTPRTRAIMPVHLYGHPCDMDPILEIARENELYVIEDCAEAIGARYKGQSLGVLGDVGCFSFFANKIITTGEGGMVVTNNKQLNDRMALLRDHGMSNERRYWHTAIGFNCRMTNVQAAIGVAQLEKVDVFLRHKRAIVARYRTGLEGIPGLTMPYVAEWADNIYWFFTVLVDANSGGITRDQLAKRLSGEGVETRPVFHPMHAQPVFPSSGSFPVSTRLAAQGLSLPTGNQTTLIDVDRICAAVRRIIGSYAVMEVLR